MHKQLLYGWVTALLFAHTPLSLYSQYKPEPFKKNMLKSATVEAPRLKVGSNTLLYEDFTGGLPAGWTNGNLNGFCGFVHTFSGPRGPLSIGMPPLRSSTAANGFMILDSDLCTQQNPGGTTDAYIETPPINITGQTRLMLRFQHNFRYCCDPVTSRIMVEVSNDRVNWVSFDVRNRLAPNVTSPNPSHQSIDISAFAGAATEVYVRFRKTGASHYWWMIDDIIIESFTENDLQILSADYNSGYTIIPDGQQQPFTPTARIRNAGSLAQTAASMNVVINQLLYDNTSNVVSSIASGQEMNLSVMPQFLPPGRGIYNIRFALEQAQNDQMPNNNLYEGTFRITDTIYSRSRNSYYPNININFTPQGTSAAGNLFRIIQDMEATSVSFVVNQSSAIGIPVRVQIYQINSGTFTEVASSGNYVLTAGDLSSENLLKWVSIPLSSATMLQAGEYVAVVSSSQEGVSIAAQNRAGQQQNTSFVLNNGQWTSTQNIPMVNLNFGNNIGRCNTMYHFAVVESECGVSTGSISVTPLTGIAPYTFHWPAFPTNNTNTVINLQAGQYTLNVTDGYGCTTAHQITVGSTEMSLDYISSPAFCGVNGAIEILPLTGNAPFTFLWSHDATHTGATATGLMAGSYTIQVTDANNCSGSISVIVENSNELPVDIHTTPSFCESPNGVIRVTPLTGVGPFRFTWTGHPDVVSGTLANLHSGDYSFTVSDANNCTFSGVATIVDETYSFDIVSTVSNASCGLHNGSANLIAQGGQSPYSFLWSNGLTTPTAINLPPGTYSVTATDLQGCTSTKSIIVATSGTMPLVSVETVNSTGCGQSTGSFTITPQNPGFNYSFTLLPQILSSNALLDNIGINNIFNKNSPVFSQTNLPAGSYNVRVVNTDGCERIVTVDINDAGGPTIIADPQQIRNISCFGRSDGSITVSLENSGTNPIFQWNDLNNSTTPAISNLPAGIYTVNVSNNEGCRSVASFQIREPAMLLANPIITPPTCAGGSNGSIQLAVTGGSSPMSFIWNTGATTRNISNLQQGAYTVTITDINYCTFTNRVTVTEPARLILTSEITHASTGGNDGSITITATGGTGSISYLWNTGQNTAMIDGIGAGTYIVTVTDGNNCSASETFFLGTVGTIDAYPHDEFRIFPNPVAEILNIEFPKGFTGNYNFEVLDVTGIRVYSGKGYSACPSGHVLNWNVYGLPKGVYFIRIYNRSNSWQLRFLKH